MSLESPDNPSTPDAAKIAALSHIVDDLIPREECADWLFAEMSKGRAAEDLAAELIANGWPEDQAADLVELVRRQTCPERGVITRDDVVRDLNQRHRRSSGLSWFAGWPALSSAIRLLSSLRSLIRQKRMSHENPTDENPTQ